MHVVDMQNCTDLTTTYLTYQYHFSFFLLSSLEYDIFVLYYAFTLLTKVLWVISRLVSNITEKTKERGKNMGEKGMRLDFYFWHRFFCLCLSVSVCSCLCLPVSVCLCLFLSVSIQPIPKVVGKVPVGR